MIYGWGGWYFWSPPLWLTFIGADFFWPSKIFDRPKVQQFLATAQSESYLFDLRLMGGFSHQISQLLNIQCLALLHISTSPLFNPNQKRWTQLNPFLVAVTQFENDVFFVPKLAQVLPKVSEFSPKIPPSPWRFDMSLPWAFWTWHSPTWRPRLWRWEIHLTSPQKTGKGGPQKSRWVEVTSMNPT